MKPKPTIFTFKHEEFSPIRVVITADNPWYFGIDIAKPLGFTKPQRAINNHVSEVQKKRADFRVKGNVPWLLNEEGVCALIEFSKMPMYTVRKFADWMHDVVFVQANQECDKMFDAQNSQNQQSTLFDGGQTGGQIAVVDTVSSVIDNADGNGAVRAVGQELTVSVFDDKDFGEIRYVTVNGEPWFIAADVCRILGLQNTTDTLNRLDSDEKSRLNLGLPGGATNVVNEPGLYRLIFASRVPKAKEFQRKVYHEILPSIRKTGSYSVSGVPTSGYSTVAAPAVAPNDKNFERGKILAALALAMEPSPTRERILIRAAELITGENFVLENVIVKAANLIAGEDFV